MKSNKGFTLIELLAVIVILGVIMAIAIPAMTGYIDDSKKDSMVSSASQYLDAAINRVTTNDMLPVVNKKAYIKISDLEIHKGGTSPYTDQAYWNRATSSATANADADITVSSLPTESYVIIENVNESYTYSIYLTDGKNCLAATETDLTGNAKQKRALVLTGSEYKNCKAKDAYTAMLAKDGSGKDIIAASRVQ